MFVINLHYTRARLIFDREKLEAALQVAFVVVASLDLTQTNTSQQCIF